MKPLFYQEQWEQLRESDASPEALKDLSTRVALSFLDHYYYNDRFDDGYIRLLCEMATFYGSDARSQFGSGAIFGIIIESLCDDFEELQAATYYKVIAQVLSFCRGLPDGTELDRRLNEFGLHSFQDLLNRTLRVRRGEHRFGLGQAPRRVFVLSRVTVGADVAITSVIIRRLQRRFPQAQVTLVGSDKLREIFGGNEALSLKGVDYPRRGSLLDRLGGWHAVLRAIEDQTPAGAHGDVILVDPDSRLSQLGALPLIGDEQYFLFNSRLSQGPCAGMCMAELANYWMDHVFGPDEFCYPSLWLADSLTARARGLVGELRKSGCRRVIAASFGVGGNDRKRVGERFEQELLLELLKEPSSVVVLDKGAGDDEHRSAQALLTILKEHGLPVRDGAFDSPEAWAMPHGAIAVQTTIGELAALMSSCDEFIGYDSACQHIAAALGINCCTVFAGSNDPRFVKKWRACGLGASHVVHVDTLTHPPQVSTRDIVRRVLERRSE